MRKFLAVTKEEFKDKYWKRPKDMSYAKDVSAVPVAIEELRFLTLSFPIVFTKNREGKFFPIALLNIKPQGNLFVSENGRWTGKYIPWFFLAHPFRIAFTEKKEPVLAVDESYVTEKEGNPFFDENGNPSKEVMGIFRFLLRRERGYKEAVQICEKLSEIEIFEPMRIRIKQENIEGLYGINLKKVEDLEDERFLSLRKVRNAFYLIYAHIFSLPNLNILANLFQKKEVESKEKAFSELGVIE